MASDWSWQPPTKERKHASSLSRRHKQARAKLRNLRRRDIENIANTAADFVLRAEAQKLVGSGFCTHHQR